MVKIVEDKTHRIITRALKPPVFGKFSFSQKQILKCIITCLYMAMTELKLIYYQGFCWCLNKPD